MKKANKKYLVEVKYPGFPNSDLDTKIERLSNKHGGSGFCFFNGKRDHGFYNLSRKEADRVSTNARKLKKFNSKLTALVKIDGN